MKSLLCTNRNLPFSAQPNGFALMSVILGVLVMGALIGVGLTLIGPRIEKEKYNQTNDVIIAAIQGVISWSATNGSLPDSVTFPTVARTPDDSWRKSLVYVYDLNLASSSTGGACGRQTTSITSGTTLNVAFLVISGGDDYTVDSIPNTSGPYNGNVTASPNDIVRLVTLKELKNKVGCYAGTLGRLRIINNELPQACTGQLYSATIYAEEGVPFGTGGNYKWCLKGSLPSGITSTPVTPDCVSTTDCASLGTEASVQWSQANDLLISGTPTASGNYPITVLVRDNNDNNPGDSNDNCEQKVFMIVVTACGGGP